jgi:uncharacterized membrane protein YqaE (UPF0057 family)
MGSGTLLSVLVLACISMLLGAVGVGRRRGAGRQVWLMLVLAAVLAVNVAIWVVPSADGTAPVQQHLK